MKSVMPASHHQLEGTGSTVYDSMRIKSQGYPTKRNTTMRSWELPNHHRQHGRARQHDDELAEGNDSDDDAAAALLALQTANHISMHRQLPRFTWVVPKPSGTDAPSAQEVDEAEQTYKQQSTRRESPRPPSPSNDAQGDTSGSCGSDKDCFNVAAEEQQQQQEQQQDELQDMEITVVSETEKGCQVWFPPLPEEEEQRRRRSQGGLVRGGSITAEPALRKRKSLPNGAAGSNDDGSYERHGAHANDDSAAPCDTAAGGSLNEDGGRAGDNYNKRPRFMWTTELHNKFVAAVNQLGVKTAVPKAILQMLNVEGMTRENVASHLQKYRMALRRSGGMPNDFFPQGSASTAQPMLTQQQQTPVVQSIQQQQPVQAVLVMAPDQAMAVDSTAAATTSSARLNIKAEPGQGASSQVGAASWADRRGEVETDKMMSLERQRSHVVQLLTSSGSLQQQQQQPHGQVLHILAGPGGLQGLQQQHPGVVMYSLPMRALQGIVAASADPSAWAPSVHEC